MNRLTHGPGCEKAPTIWAIIRVLNWELFEVNFRSFLANISGNKTLNVFIRLSSFFAKQLNVDLTISLKFK